LSGASDQEVERVAFLRFSVMIPRPGNERRVEELLDELVGLYQGRPGFITAYRLKPGPHAGALRVGRISIWESVEDADHMAAEAHDLSLQSQIKVLVDDATHQESSFEVPLVLQAA
jgi:heme-degrading monooxygenase HmoA